MKNKLRQQGFTLIELLVVVVIIGILASVAIPNFSGAQDKAKNSGVQANAHTVQLAIEQYGVDNSGLYPAKLNGAGAGAGATAAIVGNSAYLTIYPKTPWNFQQAAASDINVVGADMMAAATNKGLAAGKAENPTATTAYGAITYTNSGTASDQYILLGSGKYGGQAGYVFKMTNTQ
jgi:general secretion pathway protein G